ncbi:hypothetical protein D3C87_1314250 [compost metagenome]
MSIEAISSGFRKLSGFLVALLPAPEMVAPEGCTSVISNGTPSTTYKGSWPERIEFDPLTLTNAPAPGSPPLVMMLTPDTRPCINSTGLATSPLLKSFVFKVDTAPVRSFLLTDP